MAHTFGEQFRELRKNAGKSMGEVARYLGVSVTYISDVERSNRAPFTDERIYSAAEFMGFDPEPLRDLAAAYHGAYELPINKDTSPQAHQVGASLMRNWTALSEEELDKIADVLHRRAHG